MQFRERKNYEKHVHNGNRLRGMYGSSATACASLTENSTIA